MNPYQNIYGKVKYGKGTSFGSFVDIGGVEIGENCKIQTGVSIPRGWKIGNNVFIGPGARFANDKHPNLDNEFKPQGGVVKDGAMIGMGALIGAGIIIGKNATIGMGAVVLKDVPDNETHIGNPAKKLGKDI